METAEDPTFVKRCEEGLVSRRSVGVVAVVFDRGAALGSSGASTGRACQGRSVRGSEVGRGVEGEGCTLGCVGCQRRGAPPPGVCGSPCRSLAAGTPPPPPDSSSCPSASSCPVPSRGRGSRRPAGPPRTCPPSPRRSAALVGAGTSPGRSPGRPAPG